MYYRSLIFAPASDTRKMTKAFSLGADGVILDLEDAVAYNRKDFARQQLVSFLTGRPAQNCPTFVRVNDANSLHILADLEAVVGRDKDITGIFLAKTEQADDVKHVDWVLNLMENKHGLPPGKIELVPFVESALGIENAYNIATACPRVKRLAFGGNDFTTDTGTSYSATGEEFFYARSRLVVTSRAAGIEPPLDTVCPFIKDTALLEDDARRARKLGFQGKMVIHPQQVEPVNEIFSPTAEEVAQARKLIEAFEKAEAEGTGVIQVEGKMVEYPIVERARRILAAFESLNRS